MRSSALAKAAVRADVPYFSLAWRTHRYARLVLGAHDDPNAAFDPAFPMGGGSWHGRADGGMGGGVRDALGSGALSGYPVVGAKVTLIDGSFHQVDSSDIAFEQAAAMAIDELMKKACPILLEPVMRLQVVVPESYFGVVQGNLLGKRGTIIDCPVHGNMRIINAHIPLAEMFGYSSEIRGATAGRGSFTMEPLGYEKVPDQIAKQVIL